MDSVGTIYLDLGLNTAPFKQQMGQVQSVVGSPSGSGGGLMGSFVGLGKVIAGAFAVKAIGSFIKSSVELGSNLNEVQNVVDVTFGKGAGTINDFAKNAITQFGLSELAAKQMTGSMGAMLKSSGLKNQAAGMSMTLAGLAGDMASFYNLDQTEAFEKIRSGISGEIEPLRRLGVNLSVANLEAYAMTQGITKAYNKMSQGEQTLLRYNYLLSVTSDAQGDFARTSGSWANQTRLLSLQWDSFKASMGQGFINMLTPIIKGINELMPKLIAFGEMFKTITASIFGDAGSAATEIAVTTGEAGDNIGDLTGGLGKAGKAAKGVLAPFDRLNVLTKNLGSSGGSGGAGNVAKVTSKTQAATSETNKLNDKFKDVVDTVKGFFREVSNVWGVLKQFGTNVWEGGLKTFFSDLAITVGNLWDTGKNILGWLDELDKWAGGDGLSVEEIGWNIGSAFGWAGGALKDISQTLKDLTQGNWSAVGEDIRKMFQPMLDDMHTAQNLWNGFADWVNQSHPGTVPYWGVNRGGGGSGGGTGTSKSWSGGGGISFDGSAPYGGKSYTRPISRIPQMADGGIVSRPTLAIVGDNKRSAEAIIPLNKLDQLTGGSAANAETNRLLARVVDLLARQQAPLVEIDGKSAGAALLQHITDEARRTGTAWPVGVTG